MMPFLAPWNQLLHPLLCWLHREEIVQVLPSNTVEDMESNIQKIAAWISQQR